MGQKTKQRILNMSCLKKLGRSESFFSSNSKQRNECLFGQIGIMRNAIICDSYDNSEHISLKEFVDQFGDVEFLRGDNLSPTTYCNDGNDYVNYQGVFFACHSQPNGAAPYKIDCVAQKLRQHTKPQSTRSVRRYDKQI